MVDLDTHEKVRPYIGGGATGIHPTIYSFIGKTLNPMEDLESNGDRGNCVVGVGKFTTARGNFGAVIGNISSAVRNFRSVVDSFEAARVMRVNSVNVLDEGLRIGGMGRQMNSKVKIRQTRQGLTCIENKRSTQLAQSQPVPGQPLLAPLYRCPDLEEPVGFNTNYNVCIRCHLVFRLHLCFGLPNEPQGYQDNGPY
jgi:hypothetical protein